MLARQRAVVQGHHPQCRPRHSRAPRGSLLFPHPCMCLSTHPTVPSSPRDPRSLPSIPTATTSHCPQWPGTPRPPCFSVLSMAAPLCGSGAPSPHNHTALSETAVPVPVVRRPGLTCPAPILVSSRLLFALSTSPDCFCPMAFAFTAVFTLRWSLSRFPPVRLHSVI